MKKILSFLLAFMLLSGLTLSAFADDGDGGEDSGSSAANTSTGGNQAVKAKVTGTPSWDLVIPANQVIEYLTEKTDIVHDDCEINNPKHIPPDSTINATLTHTGKFTMDTDANKTLSFTMEAFGKEVAAASPVIVSQYWSDTNDNQCYNEINIVISRTNWENASDGGNYTTQITYTSALAVGELTDPADGLERP